MCDGAARLLMWVLRVSTILRERASVRRRSPAMVVLAACERGRPARVNGMGWRAVLGGAGMHATDSAGSAPVHAIRRAKRAAEAGGRTAALPLLAVVAEALLGSEAALSRAGAHEAVVAQRTFCRRCARARRCACASLRVVARCAMCGCVCARPRARVRVRARYLHKICTEFRIVRV